MSSPGMPAQRGRRLGAGAAIGIALLVLVLGATLLFALVNAVADDGRVVEDVPAARVTDEQYAAVELGMSKERVEQLLLPSIAVDAAVIEEYELREPDTPAAACSYYESEGGTADDRFRFCFVEDRLVDKTVILPPQDGVTGS